MKKNESSLPELTAKKLKKIYDDDEKTALAAKLLYVNDSEPGIERKKEKGKFAYYLKGKKITDDETLLRIKHLVLPPAWTNVWICKKDNGHLQATGIDSLGRKQYKYHPDWVAVRNNTKFFRMIRFGKSLPKIRKRIKKDLESRGLTESKVLALVVSLMENTNIRIGSHFYEKAYGSFGLSTLKDRHVKINGSQLTFHFKGKKGVVHHIDIRNKKLARLVKQCRDIPGKELFQYLDEEGNHKTIDSGMVNDYIREISDEDFTAKDFRTWAGTILAFMALREIGCCDSESEMKHNIITALDRVSSSLGNTRAVCKKYYIHPRVLELYQEKKLEKYFEMGNNRVKSKYLLPEEVAILHMFESE